MCVCVLPRERTSGRRQALLQHILSLTNFTSLSNMKMCDGGAHAWTHSSAVRSSKSWQSSMVGLSKNHLQTALNNLHTFSG